MGTRHRSRIRARSGLPAEGSGCLGLKLDSSDELLDTKFMWVSPLTIAGKKVWALRQGMSGEVGFELQGPREHGKEVYDALLEAGQEFGMRRMGARVAMINHLEAAYPTIATDYIPAIFGDDMAEYLEVFLSSMPSFAQPAYIAGSYPGREISEYYRSPVELGWARTVNPDHEFPGRDALAAEKAAPGRVLLLLPPHALARDHRRRAGRVGEHPDHARGDLHAAVRES
jgi:vanillate/3-O-methylgallate O-demethylase